MEVISCTVGHDDKDQVSFKRNFLIRISDPANYIKINFKPESWPAGISKDFQ